MKISARNQLKGTVSAIAEGAVNGVVSIDLGSTVVKADITMEAINDLGLKEGTDAMAIIKASNVMFAAGSERIQGISARNQIAGTVASVKKGAVNGHVAIETPEGARIMGSITNEAITLVKDTSLAFTLSIMELFNQAKALAARETNMIPYAIAALIYYVFCLLVAFVMEQAEKKMNYYR